MREGEQAAPVGFRPPDAESERMLKCGNIGRFQLAFECYRRDGNATLVSREAADRTVGNSEFHLAADSITGQTT
jgi:hypothetical protein